MMRRQSGERQQRGFALLEVVLVMAVAGALGSIIVTSLFQLNKVMADGNAQTGVTTSVQTSNRWLTRDIRKAVSTDLADPVSSVSAAQFNWDDDGTPVNCAYGLDSGEVLRTCGGVITVIARDATSLSFDRAGELITAHLTVVSAAMAGVSETLEFNVAMRGG
jgi:prepilin-type N-terminal cleavage/methylation domain-containing protein